MSVERMKILLGLDRVGHSIYASRRQQLTPGMRFTCDGMITKWIIGADWTSFGLYPELQVWRPTGEDTYHKINGTIIAPSISRPDKIFTYTDFAPIPFEAGDVLGMFMPYHLFIIPKAEYGGSYTNYYISMENSGEMISPHETINLQQSYMLTSIYHPLVSVEIGTCIGQCVYNNIIPTCVGTWVDLSLTGLGFTGIGSNLHAFNHVQHVFMVMCSLQFSPHLPFTHHTYSLLHHHLL